MLQRVPAAAGGLPAVGQHPRRRCGPRAAEPAAAGGRYVRQHEAPAVVARWPA